MLVLSPQYDGCILSHQENLGKQTIAQSCKFRIPIMYHMCQWHLWLHNTSYTVDINALSLHVIGSAKMQQSSSSKWFTQSYGQNKIRIKIMIHLYKWIHMLLVDTWSTKYLAFESRTSEERMDSLIPTKPTDEFASSQHESKWLNSISDLMVLWNIPMTIIHWEDLITCTMQSIYNLSVIFHSRSQNCNFHSSSPQVY